VPKETWTSEQILRLRSLWAEGHSAAEIGRRLGYSKNAVVGKTHREGLPSRPSPIRPDGAAKKARPARLGAVTKWGGLGREEPSTLVTLGVAAQTAVVVPEAPRLSGRSHECSYPIGEPRTPGFRYCDAPAPAGRSYCDAHHRVAHVQGPVREPPVYAAWLR